jgi:electron transfer flavoprotein alpha subunit
VIQRPAGFNEDGVLIAINQDKDAFFSQVTDYRLVANVRRSVLTQAEAIGG